MKDWILDEFGTLKEAHTTVFSDWPYSTFAGIFNGHGDPTRLETVREELDEYREKQIPIILEKIEIEMCDLRREHPDIYKKLLGNLTPRQAAQLELGLEPELL